ncbi:MAG: PRC and DUF2382 domain-containing protein [Solirubrobacterales bacterium]|nr:PRC and DUF2382 domain-containing protein [Solirubrobacterales bacterium]
MELTHAYDFEGRTLIDRDGEKIGTVDALYTDLEGGQPEWALVHTGLFGMKRSFVPIKDASASGEHVRVPVLKEQVNDAPKVDPQGELSEAEERQLFEHYGIAYTTEGSTTATGAPGGAATGGAGRAATDAPGRAATDAPERTAADASTGSDEAMTRAEEELHVGTAARERGRVRLRKYVVTEEVQKTVPVQREEVRVEREPITEANVEAATSGPDITESEHEVTLHEEEPVVEKRTVPKERVRLEKDTVTDEREVSEEVRKERIETERD